jgi:hypothetical protein
MNEESPETIVETVEEPQTREESTTSLNVAGAVPHIV